MHVVRRGGVLRAVHSPMADQSMSARLERLEQEVADARRRAAEAWAVAEASRAEADALRAQLAALRVQLDAVRGDLGSVRVLVGPLSTGRVGLRTVHETFVRALRDGGVDQSGHCQEWETFEIVPSSFK